MDENITQPITTPPSPEIISENTKKSFSKVIIILVVIIVLLLAGGSFIFLGLKKSSPAATSPKTQVATQPTQATETGNLLTGKVQLLSQDLGLIIRTDPNTSSPAIYYEAGTYTNGDYKGYKRYIAISGNPSQGYEPTYIFATNDNKKYILDGDPTDIKTRTKDGYDPLNEINKAKIIKIAPLDTSHSLNIHLDSRFTLSRNSLVTILHETGEKDQYGNSQSEFILNTDFSSYATLLSPNPKLTLYAGKKPFHYQDPSTTPTPAPEDQYIDGTTQIIVVDPTGLAYSYDLTTPQQAAEYPKKMEAFHKAVAGMSKSSTQAYPDYPSSPSLRLARSDIQTTTAIYDKYDVALPGECAFDVNTLVTKNVSDQDLQKVGTASYGDVYIFSNKNHPLIKAEYDKKLGIYNDPLNSDLYKQLNKGAKPSYDEYIAKNPLIFIKDYWGRWVTLGEYDIKLMGGCGKPVVYLYPTQPTEVSVKFTTPIKFDITIPTYQNGWRVLAQPNGLLSDLQPQFTDCQKIDETKKGSEYAKAACDKNQYPYLYWAGQSTEKPYPTISKGWFVESSNLSIFLNQKLDEVGFNTKEKNDFLEYWLPELQSKNAPYYRISFLQTEEMNSIAPMQIAPQPKSVFRLFMDWLPLKNKPTSTIKPQVLSKIVRDGFTVIEWGGLKRY